MSKKSSKLLTGFRRFVASELAGGTLLLLSAMIAIVLANSPARDLYHSILELPLGVQVGGLSLSKSLHHWVNDGLMVIFFFVVGLEIKRELLIGELSNFRLAALPIAGALGGMIIPALIFFLFNDGTPEVRGWGIPMATDIAFSLGILALVSSSVPLALKIFLTALAIVDDLGAVLVIAVFYTDTLEFHYLLIAAGILFLLIILNRRGVSLAMPYGLLGVLLWLCFLKSGVHATIAGVLLAFTIPCSRKIAVPDFLKQTKSLVDRFDIHALRSRPITSEEKHHLEELDQLGNGVNPLLERLEHSLHPWVALVIMPIFALANAGVHVEGDLFSAIAHPVGLGITLGLFLGKQLGITLFALLAVKLGLAQLPRNCTWRMLHGVSCIAGIGFTMSLFIAALAFPTGDFGSISKVGILTGSLLSAVVGLVLLKAIPKQEH